jgi:hypothetical protein
MPVRRRDPFSTLELNTNVQLRWWCYVARFLNQASIFDWYVVLVRIKEQTLQRDMFKRDYDEISNYEYFFVKWEHVYHLQNY